MAVAGFPCLRNGIENRFRTLVAETRLLQSTADLRLLCLHQTVEGARVGPRDFVFRRGPDVIPGRDLPSGIAAVLAGHIHRQQILTHDLSAHPLPAPVLYPGSTERTSLAERNEPKGFLVLELRPSPTGGRLAAHRFHELPTRPMAAVDLEVTGMEPAALERALWEALRGLDPTSVVVLRVSGELSPPARDVLSAENLRRRAPGSMSLSLRMPRTTRAGRTAESR